MFEYFRGWKRRAGLVTLAAACFLAGAWIRSLAVYDIVCRRDGRDAGFVLFSAKSCFRYKGMRQPNLNLGHFWAFGRPYTDQDETRYLEDYAANVTSEYRCLEFLVNEMSSYRDQWIVQNVLIPYWSLEAPLIAFSAWLLLSKRRQPTKPEPPRESEA